MQRALILLGLLYACADKTPEDTGSPDADGDGWTTPEDCDDESDATWPGAPEICDDLDNDCDGAVDEDLEQTWYIDDDSDGYGATAVQDCARPARTVPMDGDCDDTDPWIHPGEPEICDDLDNDCDGLIDDDDPDLTDAPTTWADADGDSWGDPATAETSCHPTGAVHRGDDCDDASADIHPDAVERCNGLDDDCDPATSESERATVHRSAGTWSDQTAVLSSGLPGDPVPMWLNDGDWTFCGGTWYVTLVIEGDTTVTGTDDAVLSGGGIATPVDIDATWHAFNVSLTDLVLVGGTSATPASALRCLGDGRLVLTRTTLRDSVAELGGGLQTDGCEVQILDGEISGNEADFGGGIWAVSGALQIQGTRVAGNHAHDSGGGIGLEGCADTARLDLVNALVTGNEATYGGGLSLALDAHATCVGSPEENAGLVGNTASWGGGVILVSDGNDTSFASDTCDFGTLEGGDDNAPDDVLVRDIGLMWKGIGNDASFSCDAGGCE